MGGFLHAVRGDEISPAPLRQFLQTAACVGVVTRNNSELTKALDILRYVVVLVALAGIAVALFG